LAKLEELIQRAELLGAQQRAGVAVARAASEERGNLRHELQSKLLLYLRAVGELAAEEDVQLVDQFRLPPSNASDQALIEVTREIKAQIRVLDGLVRFRFGDQPELMGAWASARNVLGPFKTKNEPEAGSGNTPKAA